MCVLFFFFSSRRRHTRCALVTGVQTCALPISADAVLLGAMGLPEVRYPDGREISPQVDLRELWGLFAGVRPIRAIAGAPLPLADARAAGIDFVLVREQTEGLFAARDRKSTRLNSSH